MQRDTVNNAITIKRINEMAKKLDNLEIAIVIKNLKEILRKRDDKLDNLDKNCSSPLLPSGVIRLTLNSHITDEYGRIMENNPQTMTFTTNNSNEIKAIFNEDEIYTMLVNQAIDMFRASILDKAPEYSKLTSEELKQLRGIFFTSSLTGPQYHSLLNKITKLLGGNN